MSFMHMFVIMVQANLAITHVQSKENIHFRKIKEYG